MRRALVLGLIAILAGVVALQLKPSRRDPGLAAIAAARCAADPPHAWGEDGCSLFPDGDWSACCLTHDMAYWCGGGYLDRVQADLQLGRCVNAKHSGLGTAMFVGVRLGGLSLIPAPTFRWGYGWPWPSAGG